MHAGAVVGKAAEDDILTSGAAASASAVARDRDPRRAIGRKTIDPGGNRGKGNRGKAMGLAEFDRATIARCKRVILAMAAAVPDRADGMNHMPRRQPVTAR